MQKANKNHHQTLCQSWQGLRALLPIFQNKATYRGFLLQPVQLLSFWWGIVKNKYSDKSPSSYSLWVYLQYKVYSKYFVEPKKNTVKGVDAYNISCPFQHIATSAMEHIFCKLISSSTKTKKQKQKQKIAFSEIPLPVSSLLLWIGERHILSGIVSSCHLSFYRRI